MVSSKRGLVWKPYGEPVNAIVSILREASVLARNQGLRRAPRAILAAVQREQADARLVNLREFAAGWAACLSTAQPLRAD